MQNDSGSSAQDEEPDYGYHEHQGIDSRINVAGVPVHRGGLGFPPPADEGADDHELDHHQEFEYDLLGWSQSVLNKAFPTRNLFFLQLTGKARSAKAWERTANWIVGPALSLAALPATWIGTGFRRGGTLIFASQKASARE